MLIACQQMLNHINSAPDIGKIKQALIENLSRYKRNLRYRAYVIFIHFWRL